MNTERLLHIAFWGLLVLVLLIRAFFAFRLRQAGERFMPDRAAIEREGRGAFLFRVIGFLS
jgi:hypothetical protein